MCGLHASAIAAERRAFVASRVGGSGSSADHGGSRASAL
ncbi:hypothetical protein I545_1922 [Mycobacterium kansasii 662]|uniref:Uncharacterized protein n=3 Tax=Mycobacterium kansasii TaxID=1768 RepID=A0A1V3XGR2_MYCKA|nr:hypothetical protein MKAN_07340 [Mycobacterium kansasii ATCC 12478]EUA01456.1 hypothetical protein I547_3728 [Mycobacterium kansasii 824]EUA19955.1 hypothetical protein I545_1922 [Mycobacterium kansasii 662]KEP39905.1 hypothetical protein MKSMC1_49530 [Mycobacterium kansasii]OOK78397.1 hypothetical protein BZL30_2425 [Mycobacterium kansasii]